LVEAEAASRYRTSRTTRLNSNVVLSALILDPKAGAMNSVEGTERDNVALS
jgi:hypothetical protein